MKCYYNDNDRCKVYTYTNKEGLTYYVCNGSVTVNATYDQLTNNCNLNDIQDVDCFTWNKPITSERELIKAVRY